MSKKQRQEWLKDQLARRSLFIPNDQETQQEFMDLFPEAARSHKPKYNYGPEPNLMMLADCRELYKKGEFGRRVVVGSGYGSRSLGFGSHGVGYILNQCYYCKKSLEGRPAPENVERATLNNCQCCLTRFKDKNNDPGNDGNGLR